MSATSNTPALALKLRRGAKQSAGQEIIDAVTGQLVALVPESELASMVEPLLLASPDMLWAIIRAAAHLNCEQSAEGATPETRKLCKLLRDAFDKATRIAQHEMKAS
jgi:hypothetical protein